MGRHKKNGSDGDATNGHDSEHGGKSKGTQQIVNIPVSLIDIRDGFNPRMYYDPEKMKELQEDIAKNGVIQAIMIQQAPNKRFWLVDGHRRMKCVQALGYERIKSVVYPASMTQQELYKLVYSVQKSSTLLPIEEGGLFYNLINNFGHTAQEVAEMCTVSIGTVNNRVLVYEHASPEQIQALKEGSVKFTNVLKELRDGDSNPIDTIVNPDKVKQKEEEKRLKADIPQMLRWMWGVVKSDVEEEEVLDYNEKLINYLISKFEKFEKKEKKEKKKKEKEKRKLKEDDDVVDDEPEPESDDVVDDEPEPESDEPEPESDDVVDDEPEPEPDDPDEFTDDDLDLDDFNDDDLDISSIDEDESK